MVNLVDLSKLYLDTNILVALYLKNDINPATKVNQSQIIRRVFKEFKKNKKIILYISNLVLLETFKVLSNKKNSDLSKIYAWIEDIRSTEKINNLKVKILKFKDNYSVEELFKDIRHNIVDFSSVHFQDSIHLIIMKKSRLKEILTFNAQDFLGIPFVVQIDPNKLYEGLIKER